MAKFAIEIVSDTVCPWCYVGKRQLDKAIEAWTQKYPERVQSGRDVFNISWKPFYLNPDAPKPGVDKKNYYQSRFGAERTTQIFARLTQIGAPLGINFKFGGKSGNTRDSHRLIQLGKSKSSKLQTAVVSELFKKYFEEEGDITDLAILKEAGVKAGLEEKEVTEWLSTDAGGPEVDRDVAIAQAHGISGVPNFTINGRFEIGGAQESSVFLGVFEKILSGEEGGRSEKGDGC